MYMIKYSSAYDILIRDRYVVYMDRNSYIGTNICLLINNMNKIIYFSYHILSYFTELLRTD